MATAQSIVYCLLILGLTALLLSLFFTYLKPNCTSFKPNHYEHFETLDSAAIDQSLIQSLQDMITKMTPLQDTLETTMDSIGEMKADTCEIYDEFHTNYVQARGSTAPDTSEYTLPAAQQAQKQRNRMKYAEDEWTAKKQFFQSYYKFPILTCADISGTTLITQPIEGFDTQTPDVKNLTYQLGELVAPFQAVFTGSVGAGLIQDCQGITGTSLFITKQLQTILSGFQSASTTATTTTTEGFGTYPIPFPSTSLNADQQAAYTLLSDAQTVMDDFQNFLQGTYAVAASSHAQLSAAHQQYLAYKGQMTAGVQTLNDTRITPPP
jgi:hypothetical protein